MHFGVPMNKKLIKIDNNFASVAEDSVLDANADEAISTSRPSKTQTREERFKAALERVTKNHAAAFEVLA